jgi:DNA-binding transcriptional LysR family regulator
LRLTSACHFFDRSTRHIRLTDAGLLLRPYAERVVHEFEEVRSVLDGAVADPAGLLRVSTTPAFAQELIAPMLPALIARPAYTSNWTRTRASSISCKKEWTWSSESEVFQTRR